MTAKSRRLLIDRIKYEYADDNQTKESYAGIIEVKILDADEYINLVISIAGYIPTTHP
eukprot:SAG31_NODE_4227_length_3444_cov_20.637668_1_plen_58_part_00